jgi:iron complex transport system substrate-binding protein
MGPRIHPSETGCRLRGALEVYRRKERALQGNPQDRTERPPNAPILPPNPGPLMRIVSLACSNTEIVAALGAADLLVGVDSHSDYPAAALRGLPRVGPDLEIDPEAVARLNPDLVLASLTVPGHETVVEGIEALGLPVLTLAPLSLAEVPENVRVVAARIGRREEGEVLAARLETALAVPTPDPGPDAPSILVQWWPGPVIAPGRQSWVQGLLDVAGARNPLGADDRPSRSLSPEEVAELAPDAMVMSWCGVDPGRYRPDVLYRNPAWMDVPAIREGRVFHIPEAWLGRPGPRLLRGLDALRRVVEASGNPQPAAP